MIKRPESLRIISNGPGEEAGASHTEVSGVEVEQPAENGGVSRRNFLKILGSTAAAGAVGCADSARQNVFPNVKGNKEQIPGVAVWYSSTCGECSAGCGIRVRTREGRAVKIEGNPDHPVNQGGLCGLGQASLQSLYDPDRVRQPLKRKAGSAEGTFEPVSWDEAYKTIAEALKADGATDNVFITQPLTGSIQDLVASWSKKFGFTHVAYDPLEPVALAKASELVYGYYGVPEYHFDKADVVLNFGADFLETWVSPVGFARGWAKSRRGDHPSKVIHIEPRLSLTGSNADKWISVAPGTEVRLALAVLKLLLQRGKGSNLSPSVLGKLTTLVGDVEVDAVVLETGVSKDDILLIAETLFAAKASLAVSGGASASVKDPLPLAVVTAFINLVMSSVGSTVMLGSMRKPTSSVAALKAATAVMEKGKTGVLFVHGANPEHSFPTSHGFQLAAKKVGLKVSFSSHLDETAKLADLILPSHTSLESWGDSEPQVGVHNLTQPVMTPVFDTRQFGDMLIGLGKAAGWAEVAGGKGTFKEFVQSRWEKLHNGAVGATSTFKKFWLKSVERGGYFDPKAANQRVKVSVGADAFELSFKRADFDSQNVKNGLVLMPYPSVKTFDGRAANRPWLQELPDPVTQIVWDSWVEIHPKTAKKIGIAQGDTVSVTNYYGQLNLPAFVTDYVHEDVVAVPLGQGHTAYGRYAEQVGGGNVYSMLPPQESAGGALSLLSTRVNVGRGRGKSKLVVTQGHDYQEERHLARRKVVEAKADHADHGHDGDHGHGAGHHEAPQMYDQRKHPLYKWGLAVDLAACTGCSACVVACYAENNIPTVGKEIAYQGREMAWLRIERYYDNDNGREWGESVPQQELRVSFLPMMCQHCGNAPCEPVCPVYATYHNEEGLNAMVYNRCVGTRYCGNNCSYKVRRYNWFEFDWPEPLNWQLNPDVTKRTAGVMEKCTMCVQRINEGKDKAKDAGRRVQDGEIQPACVQSCPTQALAFGDLNDSESKVSKLSHQTRSYKILDHHLNTQPAISYLEDVKNKI